MTARAVVSAQVSTPRRTEVFTSGPGTWTQSGTWVTVPSSFAMAKTSRTCAGSWSFSQEPRKTMDAFGPARSRPCSSSWSRNQGRNIASRYDLASLSLNSAADIGSAAAWGAERETCLFNQLMRAHFSERRLTGSVSWD